jgi:hypothetical protein
MSGAVREDAWSRCGTREGRCGGASSHTPAHSYRHQCDTAALLRCCMCDARDASAARGCHTSALAVIGRRSGMQSRALRRTPPVEEP